MISQQKFIKNFKQKHSIDYRKHAYISNDYGLFPVFSYEFAKKTVDELNSDLIKLFGKQWVKYNTKIDIESLRNTALKHYIENRVCNYYELSGSNN